MSHRHPIKPTEWLNRAVREEADHAPLLEIYLGENKQLRQHQIRFTSRPPKECIEALAGEGWQWHDKDRVWFMPYDPARRKRYASKSETMFTALAVLLGAAAVPIAESSEVSPNG